MYNKFDFIWNKLEVKNKTVAKDIHHKLKKFSWTIYLCSKNIVFQNNNHIKNSVSLPEYAFLIVAVVHTCVCNMNHSRSAFGGEADTEISVVELFKKQFDEDSMSMEPEQLNDFVLKLIL